MAPFYGWGSTVSRLQSHYEENAYFLPFSSQEFLAFNWLTSEGWKAELTLEPACGFESQTEHLQQWEIYNIKDFCCYSERPNFCCYLLWQFWFVYIFVFARKDRKLTANRQIKMLQKENTATSACSATFLVHLINYIAQYT